MYTFWTDLIYLAVSVVIALWVGWTLHTNGRVFLMEVFQGNGDLADSVNHLILVGFYLVSIGFVTLAIKIGVGPQDMSGAIEFLSTKVGVVLLVLGGTHVWNLFMFSRLRWRVRLVAPLESSTDADRSAPFFGMGGRPPPGEPQEHSPSGAGPDPREL